MKEHLCSNFLMIVHRIHCFTDLQVRLCYYTRFFHSCLKDNVSSKGYVNEIDKDASFLIHSHWSWWVKLHSNWASLYFPQKGIASSEAKSGFRPVHTGVAHMQMFYNYVVLKNLSPNCWVECIIQITLG